MTDTNNSKDELSQYLKRREIRTMSKDMGLFQESETQKERERLAKLEIDQAAKQEKEKLEKASKEAEDRRKAEQSALQKEEELKTLKIDRERREALLEREESEQEEGERTGFKKKFQEIQEKEETTRKEFLERVEMKTATEPQAVSPIEGSPLVIARTAPKPHFIEKIWTRAALIISILIVLATTGVLLYWYFSLKTPTMPTPPIAAKPEIRVPPLVVQQMILDFGYAMPLKPRTIDTIVVHSLYNALGGDPYSVDGVIEEYKQYRVATHYLIGQDGIIYHTVPDTAVAYHVGVGKMPDGRIRVNDFSIGVGLIYAQNETPTDKQYQALAGLIQYIQKNNNISILPENILGYKDIAPGQRTDPWNFDWQYFRSLLK